MDGCLHVHLLGWEDSCDVGWLGGWRYGVEGGGQDGGQDGCELCTQIGWLNN